MKALRRIETGAELDAHISAVVLNEQRCSAGYGWGRCGSEVRPLLPSTSVGGTCLPSRLRWRGGAESSRLYAGCLLRRVGTTHR